MREIGRTLQVSRQGKPDALVPFLYVGKNASDAAITSITSISTGDAITVAVCTKGQYQGYP